MTLCIDACCHGNCVFDWRHNDCLYRSVDARSTCFTYWHHVVVSSSIIGHKGRGDLWVSAAPVLIWPWRIGRIWEMFEYERIILCAPLSILYGGCYSFIGRYVLDACINIFQTQCNWLEALFFSIYLRSMRLQHQIVTQFITCQRGSTVDATQISLVRMSESRLSLYIRIITFCRLPCGCTHGFSSHIHPTGNVLRHKYLWVHVNELQWLHHIYLTYTAVSFSSYPYAETISGMHFSHNTLILQIKTVYITCCNLYLWINNIIIIYNQDRLR